eukprot:TRINITY_DN6821_c0_g1_i1.p1 TRINITY_DN6821_c0_g1~~TRINITY_DN6821_c0_g1_i1.p1  ORF type:complete len:245 (-),score=30.87 TRINITY_DN6821_c0_g1_i1:268-1002(-)
MLISPSALLSVWISAFALEIWSKTRERISHGGLKESLEEESLKSECAVLMRRMMDLNAADAYEHYIQAQREYIEKTKALNEIREQREQCQQSLVDLRKILHKSFEVSVALRADSHDYPNILLSYYSLLHSFDILAMMVTISHIEVVIMMRISTLYLFSLLRHSFVFHTIVFCFVFFIQNRQDLCIIIFCGFLDPCVVWSCLLLLVCRRCPCAAPCVCPVRLCTAPAARISGLVCGLSADGPALT